MMKRDGGLAGVEVRPRCHSSRFEHCGWQLVGGSGDIQLFPAGRVPVLPIVSEHFDPRSIYIFGIDPANPSINLRFTVGAITVGGEPQTANNTTNPTGLGAELLSDFFNRGDQPLMVYNWAVISTAALGSPLVFDIFNPNASVLRVFISIWGNGMTDSFVRRWREAESTNESVYIERVSQLDAPSSFVLKILNDSE